MFDLGGSTRQRVLRLEDGMTELRTDVGGLVTRIDKLVEGLSSTDGRAAERAQAVKIELRDESDRKAKERSGYLISGFSLVGAVSIIVAAIAGSYVSQIISTSHEAADDTFKIGQVRETLAEQGADLSKLAAALEMSRDRNRIQDAELREHDQNEAFANGVAAAKGWPTH